MGTIEIKDEKQLYESILKDAIKAGYKKEEVVIKKVNNTYYVGNNKNIDAFYDNDGKIINNTYVPRNKYLFKQSLYVLGYREIKSADGVYKMYNLKDIDNKTGKPLKGAKKLDIYSNDYFKLWQNIILTEDRIFLESLKLKGEEGKFLNINKGELDGFVRHKTLRIKDVVEYYKNGQIKDQNEYIRYIKLTQNILLEQIGDERAIKYGDPVTLKEINLYKKYNLIPEELYNQAKKKLEEIEKVKSNKQKQKTQIHSQTHYGVENEVMVG